MTTSLSLQNNTIPLDKKVLKKSILGLTDYLKSKNAQDILDTTGPTVNLLFNMKNIPSSVVSKPLYIDIPYPLYFRSTTQVCLIVRDPQDKWKELIHKAWQDDGMMGLSLPKVLCISKLKKNFPTMASKRTLSHSYDLFLCDTRLIEQMPRVLGRTFITAGKLPLEVPIKQSKILDGIKKRLSQTFLRIRTGPSLSVKIGFGKDAPKHVYQNALKVIQFMSSYFQSETISDKSSLLPNKIMSIYLTSTDSPSLPLYMHEKLRQAMEAIITEKDSGTLKKMKRNITKVKKSDQEDIKKRRRMAV